MMVTAMMKKPMLVWKVEREGGKVGGIGRLRNLLSSYCNKPAWLTSMMTMTGAMKAQVK